MSFVHLHNHSHYSLLDGLSRPEDIILTAKNHGSPAVALTDHGVMYGAIEFYLLAKKHGIKPIIGCEAYITDDRLKRDPSDKKSNHLLLLAKNYTGYLNLMQLVTEAHLNGFYYKPRIDHALLAKYSEGLIATSGCMIGEIPRALLNNDLKLAQEKLSVYLDIFGRDNFYLEVQDHKQISDQVLLNKLIMELADKSELPIVATNDCHYTKANDRDPHDILICLQTGKTVHDDDRMRYTSDHSMKSPQEMLQAFAERPEAIKNTLLLADKVDLKIELGQNLLPHYPTPKNEPAEVYLKELCLAGLDQRYNSNKKSEAMARLNYELDVILKMGFSDYFLIVWDFVNYARQQGIMVGPGRGSAAGSIIAYVLGITALDPLEYGLLFERFLNPERISMPDIDIDFADNRRDEIIQYVKAKYGERNVAQVITFGTMAAKAAVRDVGRAMGYPYSEVDTIAKKLPAPVLGKHAPLAESVVNHQELKMEYEANARAKALLDNAMRLEGTVRHAGTHACAVIIAEKELTAYTPLQIASGKDDTVITQYSMKPLEEIGLLKMDFLGLRNLTILEGALKIIEERHGVKIDLTKIPMDDELAFKLMAEGKTTGVFQLESPGMKRYLKDLKPSKLGDIIAMNALYRPGPMDYIPNYIAGKHDPEAVKYMHPSFEAILSETYGVCVYQEQLLEIAKNFAGFSLGEADILRKAVGKKDPVLLAEQREKFIEGAVANKQTKEFAQKIFTDVIEPFAGYGFNKSHAACYAMIAYQTAYLKAHYPTEFMAALLTADQSNTDRLVIDLKECALLGVEVLPPNVNESGADFTVVGDKQIRFGLMAIKGLGDATVSEVILVREKSGLFKGLEDFAKRLPKKLLNKKNLEALGYSGAFDQFAERQQIAEGYEVLASFAKKEQTLGSEEQLDMFGDLTEAELQETGMKLELPKTPPATEFQMLKWEKEYLGVYVSSHPLKGLGKYLEKHGNLVARLNSKYVGKEVKVYGLLTETKKIVTKRGDLMLTMKIEDPSGTLEAVVFPQVYSQFAQHLVADKFVLVEGKLEERRGLQLVAKSIKAVSLQGIKDKAIEENLYDPKEIFTFEDSLLDEEVDVVSVSESKEKPIVLNDGSKILNFPVNDNDLKSSVDSLKAADPDYAFELFVPHATPKNNLLRLKELLKDNPGKVPVVLKLQGDDKKVKSMKLKDGVNISDSLLLQLNECLVAKTN